MRLMLKSLTPSRVLAFLQDALSELLFLSIFFVLLVLHLIGSVIGGVYRVLHDVPGAKRLQKPVSDAYCCVLRRLEHNAEDEIASSDIIMLVIRHLSVKKIRTAITIGGMAIGFGSIIFLMSLGYGFERLVVSRVAQLGEMKQIDVSIGQASSLKFSDEAIVELQKIESVDAVLPMISVVSKISYNNSISDVVAFGVTSRFLQESAVQPVRGGVFTDEEFEVQITSASPQDAVVVGDLPQQGEVAGAAVELQESLALGRERSKIRYSMYPLVWKPVFESPSSESKLLGYTKRVTGKQEASEVWGKLYAAADPAARAEDERGNTFAPWIQDSFALWKKESCNLENPDCVQSEYVTLRQGPGQLVQTGFVTQESVAIERYDVLSLAQPVFREGAVLREVTVQARDASFIELYESPKRSARVDSVFTKLDGISEVISAKLVAGETYAGVGGEIGKNSSGKKLGQWLQLSVPLWTGLDCGSECTEYYLPVRDAAGKQLSATRFIRARDVILLSDSLESPVGQVLGESTDPLLANAATESSSVALGALERQTTSPTNAASPSIENLIAEFGDDLEWVAIASQAGLLRTQEKEILPFAADARKLALVNTAMLTVLGVDQADAVGLTFDARFVFDSKLFDRSEYLAESEEAEFTIVGVLPDDKTPAFYLPFNDLRSTGITNYSQVKVIVEDQDAVAEVRRTIESLGYRTSTVVDTVERINGLFRSVRLGLLIFGLVALSVAALGMFNTLTVSLLEKTREVGLMKAVGMKSREVKRLFLAESVIMGFSGGVLGLLFGFFAGKLFSLVLSSIALAVGSEPINATHIPFSLMLIIIISSFTLGVLTGLYPSYRATKISALNALRYE